MLPATILQDQLSSFVELELVEEEEALPTSDDFDPQLLAPHMLVIQVLEGAHMLIKQALEGAHMLVIQVLEGLICSLYRY
jgi:hypothetical protein